MELVGGGKRGGAGVVDAAAADVPWSTLSQPPPCPKKKKGREGWRSFPWEYREYAEPLQ